jgi:hypothetical protein
VYEGRVYTVVFDRVAVTAVQDLFEITPASNKPVLFAGLKLSQSSDFGDAQDEGLTVRIKRIVATATSGSGGTAPTPRVVAATAQTVGFSAEVNNTTQATSSGTIEILDVDVFIVRAGLLWIPPERMGFEFVNGTLGVVDLPVAPADSLTMSGTLYVVERG